jgi:carbon-monoxide dehydrogenase large subunit
VQTDVQHGSDDGIEAARFVGERVQRKEDPRLLSGRGRYVDDVSLPGLLHVAFVRSPHARARIVAVDTDDAATAPGVRAVLTYDDLVGAGRLDPSGPPAQRPLALRMACFVGDPVVLVAADTRARAEDACELVVVDYEPLPALVDARAAIADTENLVHPELGANVTGQSASPPDPELDEAIASAAHVVRETIAQHRYLAVPMETRGVVASWEPARDEMTIWLSTQGAHMARDHFANVLGLAAPRVHVVVGDVGGAFGQKINVGREETAVALASRALRRPVKWIEDRWENLVAAPHARWEEAEAVLALDGEGRIVAARADHVADAGAYAGGPGAAGMPGLPMIVRFLGGPYRVPRVGGSSATAITNTSRRGAYRGPWMFETVVRETMLDIAARRIGIDPLELRRRNVLQQADIPYTTATGAVLDHVTPAETLEQAAALIGYDEFRREQAAARERGRCLGIGIALFVEPTASGFGMGITEAATIRIDASGKVQVLTGANSQGHSVETTLAQVAAEHLGVGIDDVTVLFGDTAVSPVGAVTGGSRNAIFGGGAVRDAALEMRARVLRIAAHTMEAAAEDLDIADGVISVRGTPAANTTLAAVAQLAYLNPRQLPEGVPPGLEVATRFTTTGPTWSNAAHICTCEVDRRTGVVTLLRYVVSEDCGTIINPMVVEGQISGGVVQGIGGTLLEHFVYDGDGTPLTTTFLDYLLPTAPDVPDFEYGHIETPSARPGGFKGMGEGGAIAAPAAVFNAVADAVAPYGVTLTRQPLTPDAILAALGGA